MVNAAVDHGDVAVAVVDGVVAEDNLVDLEPDGVVLQSVACVEGLHPCRAIGHEAPVRFMRLRSPLGSEVAAGRQVGVAEEAGAQRLQSSPLVLSALMPKSMYPRLGET